MFGNSADHNRKDTVQSAVQAAMASPASDMEAWSECQRELQVRHRLFDKWVADGKISWADARDRYARLQRACAMIKRVIDLNDQSQSVDSAPETPQP